LLLTLTGCHSYTPKLVPQTVSKSLYYPARCVEDGGLAFRHTFCGERRTPSFRLPYPADLDRICDGNRTIRPFMSQQPVCCPHVFQMIAKKDQKVDRCCFINTGLRPVCYHVSSSSTHHTHETLTHYHSTLVLLLHSDNALIRYHNYNTFLLQTNQHVRSRFVSFSRLYRINRASC